MAQQDSKLLDDLVRCISGRSMIVPDLWSYFPGWPVGVNRSSDQLTPVINEMIESVIHDPERQIEIKNADFGKLTSCWYPNMEFEMLQFAAYFLLWVFVWDDEIDLRKSETALDRDKTRQYCDLSLSFMSQVLHLDDASISKTPYMSYPNVYMRLFDAFAQGLVTCSTTNQRRRIFSELASYISHVAVEQQRQVEGIVPSLDEYISMRMQSVGVNQSNAMVEPMNGIQLPIWILDSKELRAIWNATSMMCLIINDVYSVQKEVAAKAPQNLVCIMFHWSKDKCIDSVMNRIMEMLQASHDTFEESYSILHDQTKHDESLNSDLKVCVDNYRTYVTGLIQWSLESRRYNRNWEFQSNGTVIIGI